MSNIPLHVALILAAVVPFTTALTTWAPVTRSLLILPPTPGATNTSVVYLAPTATIPSSLKIPVITTSTSTYDLREFETNPIVDEFGDTLVPTNLPTFYDTYYSLTDLPSTLQSQTRPADYDYGYDPEKTIWSDYYTMTTWTQPNFCINPAAPTTTSPWTWVTVAPVVVFMVVTDQMTPLMTLQTTTTINWGSLATHTIVKYLASESGKLGERLFMPKRTYGASPGETMTTMGYEEFMSVNSEVATYICPSPTQNPEDIDMKAVLATVKAAAEKTGETGSGETGEKKVDGPGEESGASRLTFFETGMVTVVWGIAGMVFLAGVWIA